MANIKNSYLCVFACLFLKLGIVFGEDKDTNIVNIYSGEPQKIGGHYLMYADTTGKISIKELIKNKNIVFRSLADKEKILTQNVTYILKFKIKNISKDQLVIIVGHNYDFAELYTINDTLISKQEIKMTDKIFEKFFYSPEAIFVLPYTNQEQSYILRLKSKVNWGLGFEISTPTNTHNTVLVTQTLLYSIFGIIFILFFYNIIFWIRLRLNAFIFYASYLFFLFNYIVYSYGMIKFIHDFIEFGNEPYTFFTMMLTISLVLYTSSLLDIKNKSRRIYNFIFCTIILRVLLFLIAHFAKPYYKNISILHHSQVELVCLIPTIGITIYFISKKNKQAKYILITLVLIVLAQILNMYQIPFLSIFNLDGIPRLAYYICLNFLELFFLSFNLSERIIEEKNFKENTLLKLNSTQKFAIDQALEKQEILLNMNQVLEQKVASRTNELKISNEKLQMQAEEISKMNEILEQNNIKLASELENISNARLLDTNLTFDEFKNHFVDDQYCYQFLSNLKWKTPYECKKCRFKKYFDDENYSRRCRRCHYSESSLIHTLFENTRFSLLKAFYITYYSFGTRNPNITNIANLIDLRLGTALDFHNKVKKRIDKKRQSDWVSLILDE